MYLAMLGKLSALFKVELINDRRTELSVENGTKQTASKRRVIFFATIPLGEFRLH